MLYCICYSCKGIKTLCWVILKGKCALEITNTIFPLPPTHTPITHTFEEWRTPSLDVWEFFLFDLSYFIFSSRCLLSLGKKINNLLSIVQHSIFAWVYKLFIYISYCIFDNMDFVIFLFIFLQRNFYLYCLRETYLFLLLYCTEYFAL